jgi:AcrR family transcriptional regulator
VPEAKKMTRAEQKIQRPVQTLEAAFEEFTKRGFSATRVEDIADRVGVTKGTVYVYFETKEVLFESMIEHISEPFQELVKNSAPAIEDPIESLQTFLRFLYDHLVDDRRMRELLRFVIAEGPKFPELIDRHYESFMGPIIATMESILERGASMNIFSKKPSELAKVVIAPVVATMMFHLIFDQRKTIDRNEVFDTHLQLMLHGLLVQS